MSTNETREQFGSRLGFILASAGSAVGLGNIWRFPYVTGKNGGAAFLFVYLFMVLFIGFSVMLAEFVIGRKAQRTAVGALDELGGKPWTILGWTGLFAGLVILSFYGVVGGWTIKYFLSSLGGLPSGPEAASIAGQNFGAFINNTPHVIFFQVLFMAATIFIVSKGISGGIEKASKILMPVLFILMILLAIRAITLSGGMKGILFYLQPDFSKLDSKVILAAMAQAFFSLSIGLSVMLTYGSYLKRNEPLVSSAIQICFLDSFVAFLSGLIIFPAVFAFGFQPEAGPGLTFITLPAVFAKMPGGMIWAPMFFALLVIASITSSVSMLEISCSHFVDEKGWSRKKVAWILGFFTFLAGVPSAVSLTGNLNFFGKSFLDCMDFLATNILLPIGGIFFVLFTGWILSKKDKEEATSHNGRVFKLMPVWDIICKFIAPVAIAIVFVQGLR